MYENGVGGFLHQAQVEPAGTEVGRDGHHSLASFVMLQMADDSKSERDATQQIAVQVQVIDPAPDIGRVGLKCDLVKRRDMTDEARKVNKMDANIAAQVVDQALQDKAVRQESIDEHQIIFRT